MRTLTHVPTFQKAYKSLYFLAGKVEMHRLLWVVGLGVGQ